jgi:cellulose synthase/poly-beta-1,6-N-acetylglucosamine synthase-like glycosyltransferase
MANHAVEFSFPELAKHKTIPAGGAFIARSISIVIPALNEETVVEGVVRDISKQVAASFMHYEIILIDDGSTDKTGDIMDRLATQCPTSARSANRGSATPSLLAEATASNKLWLNIW